MTIAVTGATGQLGRLVIQKLKDRAEPGRIVALARTPSKAQDLGVPVREADYSRPYTLPDALSGVDTLLLISSSEVGQRSAQHRNVIEAAKAAGVQHLVYTSLLHADTTPLSLGEEHRATEADVRASGIPFTILRNGAYIEVYTGSIGAALAGGAFIGSAGNGRISAASRADLAEAAVAVLTTSGHAGRTYELAGDLPFTMSDLAAETSRQTGRNIPYRDLPVAEYAAALVASGLPQEFAHALAGFDAANAEEAMFDDSRQLSELIGRPTTPLSVAVADALARQAAGRAA